LPTGVESRLGELDPLVVAIAALAVVGLVLLAWWIRAERRAPGATLRRQLADRDDVAVLMHPNPDPDAMACAMGIAHLAGSVDTEATIQYAGQIRHQENRAFRTVLDLEFEKVERVGDVASETVVLVDHNRPRGFDGADRIEPFAVVDHHPGSGTGTAFTDVRQDYGACASVVADYFRSLEAERIPPGEVAEDVDGVTLPADVATGLLYGILSDTKHLTKGCTSADFDASEYLYPTVDEDALDRIANPEVDAEVLDVKARAIIDRTVEPPFAVSDVGTISNVDAIPQAADELLLLEGVTAVVVLGDADGTIHLSGRSRDDRVHMGRTLDRAVEDIPMSSAGGHARMGGGRVSIDHMHGIGPSDGVTRPELRDRLFESMSGEA
jgi:nanoRNase/pAp phosphatase (c-di-AMP/oligoRNAs hydrolase)